MGTPPGAKGAPAKPWKTPGTARERYDPTKPGVQNLEEKSTDPNARGVARLLDKYSCPEHRTLFLIALPPPIVTADHLPVIRLGDIGICAGDKLDNVREGAAEFIVCGLPVARKGDGMVHTGLILEGSETLIVGGPTFSLPPNIKIEGPGGFRMNVLRDLYFLSTTKNGGAILDRLAASGQPVRIQPAGDGGMGGSTAAPAREGEQSTESQEEREARGEGLPPGGEADRKQGTATGTIIKYNDSTQGFVTTGENGEDIAIPPQVGLAHELGHATRNAEGSGSGDREWQESGVAGYPLSKEEEARRAAQAARIDKARKRGPSKPLPSENDLRDELGLPKRVTSAGKPFGDAKPTKDFRPGLCI